MTKKKTTAKEAKPKEAKPKKLKQGFLSEDMAPPRDPEIDALAEQYVDARDTRQNALREEIKFGDKLLQLMKERGHHAYEYDGKIVEIGNKEKIKVRRMKEEGLDNGE